MAFPGRQQAICHGAAALYPLCTCFGTSPNAAPIWPSVINNYYVFFELVFLRQSLWRNSWHLKSSRFNQSGHRIHWAWLPLESQLSLVLKRVLQKGSLKWLKKRKLRSRHENTPLRDTVKPIYLWTLAPLSPVRHYTLIRAVKITLLGFIRDFRLITQRNGHSLAFTILSSIYTSTERKLIIYYIW